MDKAKIRLSAKEAELVANADWILTKNGIIRKAKYILEQLQFHQQEFLRLHPGMLPDEVINIPPKISKGENYNGLPYLVLDHPRYFEKGNHLAIRTMFWWGNFFSITLHLSGSYKNMYEVKLQRSFTMLQEEDLFICINDEEWEHHFEATNYRPLHGMDVHEFKMLMGKKKFIKLAKMYPLEVWENAENILLTEFSAMIKWLAG
jgi:hypothetical protein